VSKLGSGRLIFWVRGRKAEGKGSIREKIYVKRVWNNREPSKQIIERAG
jgi:hypothetical protein